MESSLFVLLECVVVRFALESLEYPNQFALHTLSLSLWLLLD